MAIGSPSTASRCTSIVAPRRAAQADFNQGNSPAGGRSRRHRPPALVGLQQRPPTAARFGCSACLSPRPLPQRGVGHTATSPPEDDFCLPKCRSSARAPASRPAPGAATHPRLSTGGLRLARRLPPLAPRPHTRRRPKTKRSRQSAAHPAGSLRFLSPAAAARSFLTTRLTMASAAGRAVQHHRRREFFRIFAAPVAPGRSPVCCTQG